MNKIEELFLQGEEVEALTGLSKSTLWRLRSAGLFPNPKEIAPNRVGWLREDIVKWARSRPEAKTQRRGRKGVA